jgi:hypothetical protein
MPAARLVVSVEAADPEVRQRCGAGMVGESVRQLGQLSETGVGQQGQASLPKTWVEAGARRIRATSSNSRREILSLKSALRVLRPPR